MSDFDSERSWAQWWHRTGKKTQGTGKTAQQRAKWVRNRKAAADAQQKVKKGRKR